MEGAERAKIEKLHTGQYFSAEVSTLKDLEQYDEREMDVLSLRWRAGLVLPRVPRIHDREIVLDDALPIGGSSVRFAAGIDLVALARLAVAHDSVPAVVEAYQRTHGATDLRSLLAVLSLLIAEDVLQ